jgi:hypothetical protein
MIPNQQLSKGCQQKALLTPRLACCSGGGMGPAVSRSPQPPDISEDTPYEGLVGEPDPFSAGHELYRALRGDKGDDPLTDELLWEGDFMSTQRDFIQKKQEDELLERLERRMGEICFFDQATRRMPSTYLTLHMRFIHVSTSACPDPQHTLAAARDVLSKASCSFNSRNVGYLLARFSIAVSAFHALTHCCLHGVSSLCAARQNQGSANTEDLRRWCS